MAFPTARPIALQTFWQLWPRRAVQQVHQQNQIPSDPFRSLQTLRFRSVMEVDFVRFLPGFSENTNKSSDDVAFVLKIWKTWKSNWGWVPSAAGTHRKPRPTAQYWKPSCRMGNIQVQHAAREFIRVHNDLSWQRKPDKQQAWLHPEELEFQMNKTKTIKNIWPWTSKHTAVYPNASPIVDFETTDPGF